MVTEKDIMNMGRKIKRYNNPKTLARYQAHILALEEKIKMEEEAHAAQKATQTQDPNTGKFAPVPLPRIGTGETRKEVAVKIAEKAGVSPRKCYSYHEFERLHLRRSRF